MKIERLVIRNIPVIKFGEKTDNAFLYVHGKKSNKEEAEEIAKIIIDHGYQVISFDLPEHGERKFEKYALTVQNAKNDLNVIHDYIKGKYASLSLFACSLGVYFSLVAYKDIIFNKCLFLSPVLDMERLIRNMMKWSNVTECQLRNEKIVSTSFDEILSWEYFDFVKNNPIKKWNSPTSILYGESDNITERETLDNFVQRF